MKPLPSPEVYEKELSFMPYKDSLAKVLGIISSQTPVNGSLLDLMCGPGYLLGQIAAQRTDLSLHGVDFDKRYVDYAKKHYPIIDFQMGDALTWKPIQPFDAVICTGALHHIPYEKQAGVVERMASMVKPDGFCIVSDCYIDDYSREVERRLAAAKLGDEYLRETKQNGAPDEVIEELINIRYNDVMMHEFKTSLEKRLPIFGKNFKEVEVHKTWPDTNALQGYGDYVVVCRK